MPKRSSHAAVLSGVATLFIVGVVLQGRSRDAAQEITLLGADEMRFIPVVPMARLQALVAKCDGDNPIAAIHEVNVLDGATGWGPDWPNTVGPDPDCAAMKMAKARKVYEIGEPNFQGTFKEYKPENNIFPYTAGKSGPDAPKPYSAADEVGGKLFDGHGGITGLEDSMNWMGTPDSVAPKKFGKYADGSKGGMDRNVFANGYKFPDY